MLKLEVEKKVILECGSYALDEFLSELIGYSFEFEAYEELGYGDVRTFDVKPEAMDPEEFKEAQFGKLHYQTGSLLNEACARGLIEPGEYVIHNRM
jgi:hypothetical protein